MSSIVLTRAARRDLDEIWDHVAGDFETRADRLIDWLTSKFEKLADSPFIGGKWRPSGDLRVFSAKQYTIFYVPAADGVEIRRVIRAGPDLDTLDLD